MFPARGSYWRRQINILGEAGKICWGENGKNKVLKRGAESVRKQVMLLVYHHTA